MSVVLGIVAFIAWLIVQYNLEKISRDAGAPLLSRRQLRYMRRKARRTGTTLSTVNYEPRTRQSPLFLKDWLGPNSLSRDTVVPTSASNNLPQSVERQWRGITVVAVIVVISYLVNHTVTSNSPQPAPSAPFAAPVYAAEVSTPPIVPSAQPQRVRNGRTKQGANLRGGPSNAATILRTIPANTAVRIIETNGRWARIALDDAAPVGWVYRPLIE